MEMSVIQASISPFIHVGSSKIKHAVLKWVLPGLSYDVSIVNINIIFFKWVAVPSENTIRVFKKLY